jgi:hypothetical protein
METIKNWFRIKLHDDHYEGWIDSKQARLFSEENYRKLAEAPIILNNDLV